MLWLFFFLIYGLVVGMIAKLLHPGPNPVGFLPTIIIGVVGSYIGGLINFLLGRGHLGSPSGIIMGIIGGVLGLIAWRWWTLQTAPEGPRSFWTGKQK
jgi:uncharacterized membrane protein YeaQ/YmgE (transglycosylase-associated protein family)